MNKIIAIVLLLTLGGCRDHGGSKGKPSAAKLVEIVKNQDLQTFVELVNPLDYKTTMSFTRPVPFVQYVTNEPVPNGNTLTCFYSADKMMYLLFTTLRPQTYEKMKKQIEAYGFTNAAEYYAHDEQRVQIRMNDKGPEATSYEFLFFKVTGKKSL